MKLKPLIGVTAVGLAIAGSYAAAVATGHNPGLALTQARCSSGAFLTHAASVGSVAADSATSDNVTINNQKGSGSSATNATTTSGSNLIPNPGLEQVKFGTPANWLTNVYGSNNATFTQVAGHDSATAIRVTIPNYSNGDSDWYYDNLGVKAGQYYEFSDYYRSNVTTRPILALTDSTGATQYVNLASVPAASTWTAYHESFFIPQNVTKAIVFHPLAAQGWLETDDYSLKAAEVKGFDQAMVSITFDDGWKSIHDNALPVLKQYDFPSTQYLISGYLGGTQSYMNAGDAYDLQKAGSEIASHTVDHVDLTMQSPQVLSYELTHSKQNLAKCFGSVTDFAEPLGTYNADTEAAMAKSYTTARSTDAGFNTADNLNPYALKVQNVSATTTNAQIAAWIETARANNVWLILVYHQIDSTSGSYARSPKDFAADMKTLKDSGVKVETVHDAYAHVKSQVVKP